MKSALAIIGRSHGDGHMPGTRAPFVPAAGMRANRHTAPLPCRRRGLSRAASAADPEIGNFRVEQDGHHAPVLRRALWQRTIRHPLRPPAPVCYEAAGVDTFRDETLADHGGPLLGERHGFRVG